VAYNYVRLTGKTLEGATILDYGCGYGRIARLMYMFTDEHNLFAVDPWDAAIALCNKSGLSKNYNFSEYLPKSLSVGDARFELIYAFSVFTHLSQRATFAALKVLRKYVADRGVLVITVRPIEYWQHDQSISVTEKTILIEQHRTLGFAFRPHLRESIDGGLTYEDTSVSVEWVANNFPEWSIAPVDRSPVGPLQGYLFLLPKN
jgi:SAM-dependent methyltransferase